MHQIDTNHRSSNQALNRALDEITDTFRPERKEKETILLNGHRVMQLVKAGRYSFENACIVLRTFPMDVREAFNWLQDDNARLNVRFDTDIHGLGPRDYIMVGWFNESLSAVRGKS
jgi:hypothetical protein